MRGLKITLLLVLVAVFAYCDTGVKQFRAYNYGQNPLIQSRGLDILSLRKNENLDLERKRGFSGRDVVYPAQTYDSQSRQLRTESSSMNLRGTIDEDNAHVVINPDSSDVEKYRIHTHHWRPNQPLQSYDQASRSRNVDDANDEDVVNQAEAARLQEQRAADAEKYRIHTHHWRPEDQPPPHLADLVEPESRSRNIRDNDSEDDIINSGEDARLQELRQQDSRSRAVFEVLERSEEDKQREQREAEAEQYRIHTHVWRAQPYTPEDANAEQSSSSRSRSIYSEPTDEDVINSGEDARLQELRQQDSRSRAVFEVLERSEEDKQREQREAEAEKYRIHTHVWRPQQSNAQQRNAPNDVYQEGQIDEQFSVNARTVDEDQENEIIARAEEARLQEQRASEAERYRHTHRWRPEDQPQQQVADSGSRSRNVRDAEDDIIDHGEDARLQELRAQDGTNNAREAAPALSRIHTHVWRQEPYQEQEQREADIARAIRARNVRDAEPVTDSSEPNPVHTHVWRGSVPVNDLNTQRRNVVPEDESDRIRHGQHVPDTPFQEYNSGYQARSYQARDADASVKQDYHIPRGMQIPAVDLEANSESNNININ